jgi:TonB family protein
MPPFVWLALVCFCPLRSAAQSGIFVPVQEQVRLSEILIATPQPYDQAQLSEAQRKAQEIREAIRRGEKFEELAKTFSQGPSASKGGDLGFFMRGKLAPALENVAFAMKAGETSDIIRTKQGYVILEVTDRIEQEKLPLEVLNAPLTTELRPYLQEIVKRVRQKWYRMIPDSAKGPTHREGHVDIQFVLHRDGSIADEKIGSTSDDENMGAAALKAVEQANPFRSFPSGININQLVLLFHFEYNPDKVTASH